MLPCWRSKRNDQMPFTPHHRGQWRFDPLARDNPWSLILSSNNKGPICQVRYCRTPKRTSFHIRGGRIKGYLCTVCSKCNSRRWRANHPVAAALNAIRDRAKRRGQFFDLTLAQLQKLVEGTNYATERGRKPQQLHIDREIPSKGYTFSNLQILTASANTRKRHTHDYL